MVKGFYDSVRTELKDRGYVYLGNAKGSHEKWEDPSTGKKVIVPYNLKSRHTANSILKEIGSKLRF